VPNFSWTDLLIKSLPAIAIAIAGYMLYSWGEGNAEAEAEALRNKEKLAHQEQVDQLKEWIADNEERHRRESQRISDQLAAAELSHASSLAALHSGFALRLQQSDDRAEIYQHLSGAGTTERSRLASHTAELDRSLEEGRLLVAELRSTVEQRDRQLILLGEQLQADRQLINAGDKPDLEQSTRD